MQKQKVQQSYVYHAHEDWFPHVLKGGGIIKLITHKHARRIVW